MEEMIFDYFDKICGTYLDQGHYELVLYKINDGYKLVEYIKAPQTEFNEETIETSKEYKCASKIIDEINEIIKLNKIYEWNNRSMFCGFRVVFKFKYNDKLYNVSTDNMPEDNGMEVFNLIKSVMKKYLINDNLI